MAEGVKLIVGLGNPTAQYEKTRHNAGFWFLDGLARRYGIILRPESRFQGEFGRHEVDGRSVFMLKPSTYMNRSGQSVAAVATYYKIAAGEILVVHDELDLPPGVIRLKVGGGHGGHNGLRDIVAHMGTQNFPRLRLGIGHPGDRLQVSNYVLGAPGRDDERSINEAINRGLGEIDILVRGGYAAVMNRLNSVAASGGRGTKKC